MGSESDVDDRAGEAAARLVEEDRVEAKIDRDLRDSFPASDPPGWVLGVNRPAAGDEEEEPDGPAAAD